jgi:hypothetical protein
MSLGSICRGRVAAPHPRRPILPICLVTALLCGCGSRSLATGKRFDAAVEGPAEGGTDVAASAMAAETGDDGASRWDAAASDPRTDGPWEPSLGDTSPVQDSILEWVWETLTPTPDSPASEAGQRPVDGGSLDARCDTPPAECWSNGDCGQPCCVLGANRFNAHCAGTAMVYIECANGTWRRMSEFDNATCSYGPP